MLTEEDVRRSESVCLYNNLGFLFKVDSHPMKDIKNMCPTTGTCHWDYIFQNHTGGTACVELKTRTHKDVVKAVKYGSFFLEPEKKDCIDWFVCFCTPSSNTETDAWKDVWVWNIHMIEPTHIPKPIWVWCQNSNRYELKIPLPTKYADHYEYIDKRMTKTQTGIVERYWEAPEGEYEYDDELSKARLQILEDELNKNKTKKHRLKYELIIEQNHN